MKLQPWHVNNKCIAILTIEEEETGFPVDVIIDTLNECVAFDGVICVSSGLELEIKEAI